MYQKKGKVLAIEFTCPTTIEVGDVVVLTSGDQTVAKVSTEASLKRVGTVATHQDGATTCVVETPFRERRDDRVAATVFANGPFVWDATGKAASYVQGTIASVTGTEAGPFTFTATAATPAVGTESETFDFEAAAGGTVTSGNGPFTFGLGASDAFKIKIGAAAAQDFTLTGSAQTAAQVASQFSAGVGFTATAVDTTVVFAATTATDDLEIVTVSNNAYTVMGLSIDVYEATEGNNTLKLNVDGEASQTFTLTGSGRTAAQVAAQISGTGFTATAEDGSLVLTADDPESDLEIEATDNDCYTELGLVADTYPSVPGDNRLLIAITGGGESGGADQEFEITAGERTATQVAQEINLTAQDFEASASSDHIIITASQIGDDVVIKPSDADAYTILGFSAGTTAGDVANYSAAAIAGVKISGPELCSVQSVIEAPYNIGASTNKLKLNIGSGLSQTFTLSTDSAALPHELAETINATATGFEASSTGAYLVLTALAAGDDIEIESVSNNCYSVVGLTVGTTAAPMIINTLEK